MQISLTMTDLEIALTRYIQTELNCTANLKVLLPAEMPAEIDVNPVAGPVAMRDPVATDAKPKATRKRGPNKTKAVDKEKSTDSQEKAPNKKESDTAPFETDSTNAAESEPETSNETTTPVVVSPEELATLTEDDGLVEAVTAEMESKPVPTKSLMFGQ